jgi:hypothetical protein
VAQDTIVRAVIVIVSSVLFILISSSQDLGFSGNTFMRLYKAIPLPTTSEEVNVLIFKDIVV